jgi:hypothetical protein
MADYVSFNELAKRLGIDSTTVRRNIDRVCENLGISVKRDRGNKTNRKITHYLSREDADRFIAYYESKNEKPDMQASEDAIQALGVFYVIQLIPEALPNRLKIGYTDNLEMRLATHQTAAPTARVLASWPCKRSWDYAAMDSITREDCAWVLNEVFEGDPEGFLRRGNEFFALMPKSNSEIKLSEHSPQRDRNEG